MIELDYDGNNYKQSDRLFLRGEEIKQRSLHEHFLSDGHQSFEEDVSICLIDKTDTSDPHKREHYWMRTLKTIAPLDLTPKKHTEQYIPLCALHQSYQFMLLIRVCKSDCSIVTLLLRFYFFALLYMLLVMSNA